MYRNSFVLGPHSGAGGRLRAGLRAGQRESQSITMWVSLDSTPSIS